MDTLKSPNFESRIWLALRMGWVLSEIYGQLTKPNIRWKTLFPSPSKGNIKRLFISTREPSSGESLWADLLSLIFLIQKLYPPTDEVAKDSSGNFSNIHPPESVLRLIESAQQVMLKENVKFELPESFLNDFNHWSRQIWAILNAEDILLAEAATLGAGLADTYWQWRPESYSPIKNQTWQKMLIPQRMLAMIRRIRQIDANIPDYVSISLRHSLREWGRAAGDGTIKKLLAPVSGQETDANGENGILKMGVDGNPSVDLSEESVPERGAHQGGKQAPRGKINHEVELREVFRKQLIIWEDLIFNRPAAYHLKAEDWWRLRALSMTLYLVAASFFVIVPALFFYGLILITNGFLTSLAGPLLNWVGDITTFDAQLKLATSIVTVFAFLATQFRKVAYWIRELYPSIYNWLYVSILIQRTFVSWDGKIKPISRIWWRRLFHGDN